MRAGLTSIRPGILRTGICPGRDGTSAWPSRFVHEILRISIVQEKPSTAFALVVVGMCGSGKIVGCRAPEAQGLAGCPLRRHHDGGTETPPLTGLEANERRAREETPREGGMDAYAQKLLPIIRDHLSRGPLVLDGLYSWSEYKYLLEHLRESLAVVAVVAPRAVRYARLAARPERPLSADEALSRDIAEIETLEKGGPDRHRRLHDPQYRRNRIARNVRRSGCFDRRAAALRRGRYRSAYRPVLLALRLPVVYTIEGACPRFNDGLV